MKNITNGRMALKNIRNNFKQAYKSAGALSR